MVNNKIKNNRVVFVGAGNVATHLSSAMQKAGFSIIDIFSRSVNSAQALAKKIKCTYTTNIQTITPDADIYIFAVKDDALSNILAAMPANKGLWIHTAGSLSMNVFNGYATYYGVIYPLLSLSKQRKRNFFKTPLFVEGNTADVETIIYRIASMLSESVTVMPSDKRKYLHLAAVIANNFSNHLYMLSAQLLEKQFIDWRLLLPAIDETARKLHTLHPKQAQTGPAIRCDRSIMDQHLAMLDDDLMRKLYAMISESIYSQHINK